MGQPFGSSGIDTPTLLGVWGTAPYFHDGSAATLDAVVESGHGIPGNLPAADREALVAFLESLQRPAGEFVQVKVKSGDLCWEAEPAAAAELVLAACNSGEPRQFVATRRGRRHSPDVERWPLPVDARAGRVARHACSL